MGLLSIFMRNISRENLLSGVVFLLIAALTSIDIYEDYHEGAEIEHILLEILIGLFSYLAAFYLFKKINDQFQRIKILEKQNKILEEMGKNFKDKSKAFMKGLSVQIDDEFTNWKLSPGEREIGLFLLKGLTTHEISDIRGSAEKTVRHQMTSIYKKAGIKNRHEFQAYFLEDLLIPSTQENDGQSEI